jgi:hypothetical protein
VLEPGQGVMVVRHPRLCYNSKLVFKQDLAVSEGLSMRTAPIDGHCKAGT